MNSYSKPTTASSLAHPETMDLLSTAWCNFAVQALKPESNDRSIVLLDSPVSKFDNDIKTPVLRMDRSIKINETLPSWKSSDVKSWIWMQQAMHPELNYNSCFRKKWVIYPKLPWKKIPLKMTSIKKWLKEIKLKRKEEERLEKAEIHAAISIAGVAAALAALAAADRPPSKQEHSALACASALVAAQCAQVAEAMGAKREELSTVIGSAMCDTNASDILTLTAAASTSLRGAAALKTRRGCGKKLNGCAPVLPIEESHQDEFDFERCRSTLSKGAELNIETSDGKCRMRLVSISLNNEAKVILKIKKLNILNTFTSTKPRIILDLHAELYKDSEDGEKTDTCYLIVLTTNHGTFKLDMSDDYLRYKTWTMTINHMLMLSSSFTRYELEFYKN